MKSDDAKFSEALLTRSTIALTEVTQPKYCNGEEFLEGVELFKKVLGAANVSVDQDQLLLHSNNPACTHHPPKEGQVPECVVYPESTEQVVEMLKISNRLRIPVVPFGAGSSLEGHIYSTRQPCVVVDLRRMNKILEIHDDDMDVVVQAGVPYGEVNRVLEPYGLMMGSDCAPDAVIGGMIATNASGINACAYGPMRDNVISATVVLADGTVVKTKQRPRKSSAGYNLTGLVVGSEGTLGIVTQATIKVHVKPKHEKVAVVQFKSVEEATTAVTKILKSGIKLNAIELLDANMMRCINYAGSSSRTWDNAPSLFLKINGVNPVITNELVKEVKTIANGSGAIRFTLAKDEAEAKELFDIRKNAHYSVLEYTYGTIGDDGRMWGTDVAVPLSKLTPVLEASHRDLDKANIDYVILGHVGDSNFHFNVLYKPEQESVVRAIVDKMVYTGLANEGTCTGEHGVGNGKRKYLEAELGPDAINLMRKLKLAVDPNRIMNPDKVFAIDPFDTIDSYSA
ncbi:unnamed protein product [Kuraishia capsulata CBS 1993]|uniref:D-lactate dehydrogenase (cytochrome) n=1 Tax=Kuraishia capsulata CBS 1993 TaxID=1382522 RepID=W6MKN4_9ASCO|nr:uncharacterized protein KUCA_T00002933001 [Kuraishia capsulata CBS 1993]CDK26956.1 unnamed protein product [Kuraishia capsulata CBS 1993]